MKERKIISAPLNSTISLTRFLNRAIFSNIPGDRKRQPEEEHKLEYEVEGEPRDNVNQTLDDGEERKHNPVLSSCQPSSYDHRVSRVKLVAHRQPLSVILGGRGEERIQRVVTWNDETGYVGEKLAAKVEDDEEEIEGSETDDSICLGNTRLPFEINEGRVLGQLRTY